MAQRATRQRSTVQGGAVRDALAKSPGFRSAQDVYSTLRSEGRLVGLSTVYRHLQSFADEGAADVIHTPDGEKTYRLCGTSSPTRHHHHLVCRRCGRAEEVEGRAVERWASDVADKFGFTDVDHTVEVFGVCQDCARA